MANATKPLLRSHKFFGEDEAHDLIVWMNCNEYPANRWVTVKNRQREFRRVFNILELARQVENDLAAIPAEAVELGVQVSRLNRAVARYTFKPHFPDPPRFCLSWRAPTPEKVIPSEHRAILSLLRLLELRLLYRVRACFHCTKWFFARYRHSKFCKKTCQQKHYALSAAFRMERRTYMREYRRKHGY
jgi:hypothetical protein